MADCPALTLPTYWLYWPRPRQRLITAARLAGVNVMPAEMPGAVRMPPRTATDDTLGPTKNPHAVPNGRMLSAMIATASG